MSLLFVAAVAAVAGYCASAYNVFRRYKRKPQDRRRFKSYFDMYYGGEK